MPWGVMVVKLSIPPPPRYINSMTLSDAARLFLDYLQASGASPSTLKPYRAALKSFTSHVGGDMPVSRVEEAHYISWVRWLQSGLRSRGSGRRANTIHYYTVFVRRFLKWIGMEWEPIVAPRRRTGFSDALDWGEVTRLLEASRDLTDALIVALLAETGLRAGELLSLRYADVDLRRGEVRVVGKYGKERIVFLGPISRAILASLIERLRPRPGDPIIGISYQALYKRLKTLARRAGLDPRRVRPHVLRHTFATEALRRGMSLPALQKLLGHSDIKITELYLHMNLEDIKREYNSIFTTPPPEPYNPLEPNIPIHNSGVQAAIRRNTRAYTY